VAAPRTEVPGDPPVSDERTTLESFLDYQRAVLARKAEGLTDEESRRATCPPSDMTMLGLVRHLAEVERSWFRRGLAGQDAPPIFYGDAHPLGDPDGDFHPPADATIDAALATLADEIAASRAVMADIGSLDDLERAEHPTRDRKNVRWILAHMIEEYARHLGQADLIREAIDGATGD
jgi:uncharacterized damage-inducible protein DinB